MHPDEHSEIRHYIGLAEAAKMLRGRGGKHPSIMTLRRWSNAQKGYRPRGYQGEPLILRTIRIGNNLCTLPVWIKQFERAQIAMGERRLDPPPRTRRSAAAAQRRATRQLEAMGIHVQEEDVPA